MSANNPEIRFDNVDNVDNVDIAPSWKSLLASEFTQPYFTKIKAGLLEAKSQGQRVFPPCQQVFSAFNLTPVEATKVVIIGQDPYHKLGQAMGLSFSVPRGVRVPPSLINIYKELERSIEGFQRPDHGDLTHWAAQGALMLNASLTVAEGQAGSHSKLGWQQFTDAVIREVSAAREGVIFLLWGNFAKKKAKLIDASKHHILTAVHPSPLAGGGFFGCNHFVECNQLLINSGRQPIDWQV